MANRRNFIKNSLGLAAGVLLAKNSTATASLSSLGQTGFKFEQVPLGYAYNALEGAIDATTMQIHYEKHYGTYVKNANDALVDEKVQAKDAKAIFASIDKYSSKLRNNAGGAFNHAMFWTLLRSPKVDNKPTGSVLQAINKDFGGFDQFKEQFAKAATSQFGSGWAWLVVENGKLKVGGTANQDNPLMKGVALQGKPILGLDVWEHAYYLKYQNKRPDYVGNFWSIVNWDQVQKYYDAK
ncbi:superoxide dismutase [Sphingobacterium sp. DK4209]|uniref:Superoxide dismutase n=1 Tax=Sphingobacterium zhuxiongii TaxID=2662364 RepID=A0A5Q0Q6P2_9SPHI|nr:MULTISPECIES: superoxide dismutase [unclassified Sphingobacterium]MVZ64381.1 superoxide dismutase [Sphingobacterium sp. DK4209]QGA25727.1 superoxide dismutase [Sphingobacterium sp. dk4302]